MQIVIEVPAPLKKAGYERNHPEGVVEITEDLGHCPGDEQQGQSDRITGLFHANKNRPQDEDAREDLREGDCHAGRDNAN